MDQNCMIRLIIIKVMDVDEIKIELMFKTRYAVFTVSLLVHPSREPGWLEGTLDGRTGLIPENYVAFM